MKKPNPKKTSQHYKAVSEIKIQINSTPIDSLSLLNTSVLLLSQRLVKESEYSEATLDPILPSASALLILTLSRSVVAEHCLFVYTYDMWRYLRRARMSVRVYPPHRVPFEVPTHPSRPTPAVPILYPPPDSSTHLISRLVLLHCLPRWQC